MDDYLNGAIIVVRHPSHAIGQHLGLSLVDVLVVSQLDQTSLSQV
jgi:hypothetical protein